MRAPPRRIPQVRPVTNMFSQYGQPRLDSRCSQIQLVRGFPKMMTDPIADMLTRIRNAVSVERQHVDMPVSKLKRGVADVLKREGFIWDWKEIQSEPTTQLRLELKYGPSGE